MKYFIIVRLERKNIPKNPWLVCSVVGHFSRQIVFADLEPSEPCENHHHILGATL